MTKKELITLIGSAVLLVILAGLFLLEMKYPTGGTQLLARIFH